MSACQSEKADRANEKRSKLSYLGARVLSQSPDQLPAATEKDARQGRK